MSAGFPAQIKFHLAHHVTSRHDTTHSTCRARASLAVSSLLNSTARHARLNALDTSNVSCRDVTSQVEFWLLPAVLFAWLTTAQNSPFLPQLWPKTRPVYLLHVSTEAEWD